MTKDETLKLALEALKYPLNQSHENFNVDMAELLAHRAITAIKEALAQPERYPDTLISYNCTCGKTMKFESVNGIVAPQRTWVGLPDEEILLMANYDLEHASFIGQVQKKLKEKNSA